MQLYYAPNTISIAVAIALHEAGLDFEATKLSFAEGEQTKPDYLSINPKGRVPTLIAEGKTLTETGALLEYIATLNPDAGLTPADPIDAQHMRSVMYYLASTAHVNHAHKMRGTRWADNPDSHADMTAKVPETMHVTATYFEEHCLRGDYVLGSQFSIADPYLFVICCWLEGDGVALEDFTLISEYMARMKTRASVQRVTADGMLTA